MSDSTKFDDIKKKIIENQNDQEKLTKEGYKINYIFVKHYNDISKASQVLSKEDVLK